MGCMRVSLTVTSFCLLLCLVHSAAAAGCTAPRPCSEYRSCGQIIKKAGSLNTPSYPLHYRPCTQCTWRLTVAVGQKVHLEMGSFRLGRGDYVRILDGPKQRSRLLMELVDRQQRVELVSSGRHMTVTFKSNELDEDEGFRADFSGTHCGGLVRFRSRRDIRSPATSRIISDYPSNSNCIWFIRGRGLINTIQLQFAMFRTEKSKDEALVREAVSNFHDPTYKWSGPLSGYELPTLTFNETAGLLLRFSSDSSVEYEGFRLTATVKQSVQECEPPKQFEHGYVFRMKLKSIAGYSCETGFKLEGHSQRRCVDGQWIPREEPTCALITHCPTPVPPEHGFVVEKHSNVSEVGRKVHFSCVRGFSSHGGSSKYTATCRCNGQWKYQAIPNCKPRQCPSPPPLNNGSFVTTPGVPPYYYGTMVQYTCDPGLVLDGIPRRWCSEHGHWDRSFSVHQCIVGGKTCPEPVSVVNGIYRVRSYLVGRSLVYGCNEGYRLDGSSEFSCQVNQSGQPSWDGTPPSCIDTYDNPQKAAAQLVSNFVDRFVTCSDDSTASNLTSDTDVEKGVARSSVLTATWCKGGSPILVGTGVDVVFVVDCSGSVGKDSFQQILKLVSVIVSLVDDHSGRARFAMVTYDTEQYLQFGLNRSLSQSEILQKIRAAKFCGGGTATRKVLDYVQKSVLQKSREASEKVVFVVTDGKTNWAGSPLESAKSIRSQSDTSIYCIAFGSQVNKDEINRIASREDYVIRVRSSNDVAKVADTIQTTEGNYSECGVSVVPDCRMRVVGGCGSQRGARPWMAGIYLDGNGRCVFLCGGTLIGSCWVLTAAHCFDNFFNVSRDIEQLIVVVGDTVRSVAEGTEKLHGVDGVIIHPSYNASKQNFDYDAALLKLSCSVSYSPFVRRACLPRAGDELLYRSGTRGLVAGWGVVEISREGRNFSQLLREAELPVTGWKKCRRVLGFFNRKVTERMFCAGDGIRSIDACYGDSGGPFVVQHRDERYRLTGIVSWGIGCALRGLYGVYTDVMSIMPWILETMESTECPGNSEVCPTFSCKGMINTVDGR